MAPAVLITLGVLFLLDTLHVPRASFHNTWPVLFIVIGLVKVLQGNAPTEGHVNLGGPAAPVSGPPSVGPSEPMAPDGQVDNG
jgi:hypothetical protein